MVLLNLHTSVKRVTGAVGAGGRFPFVLKSGVGMLPVQLLPPTQITTSNTVGTTPIAVPFPPNALAFVLDLTASQGDVVDTLDVYVQAKLDGVNWIDVVHFVQVLGTTTPRKIVAKTNCPVAEATFQSTSALGGGSVRNLIAGTYRLRWDVADADLNAQWSVSVVACPM